MLTPAISEALNKQLNREYYSWYVYLALAAFFEKVDLEGFSIWARARAAEELGHAQKFYDYIINRGGEIELFQIDAPNHHWENPIAAMEAALQHEKSVTKGIHGIMSVAREHSDFTTEVFVHWFVNEQIEEENSVEKIVQKMKMVEGNSAGLFILDTQIREMEAMASQSPA